jgi:hypothetical protein
MATQYFYEWDRKDLEDSLESFMLFWRVNKDSEELIGKIKTVYLFIRGLPEEHKIVEIVSFDEEKVAQIIRYTGKFLTSPKQREI